MVPSERRLVRLPASWLRASQICRCDRLPMKSSSRQELMLSTALMMQVERTSEREKEGEEKRPTVRDGETLIAE